MMEVMRMLSEQVGVRFAGTESEHEAAARLTELFSAEGVQARLQRYGFIGWATDRPPRLQVLSPVQEEWSVAPVVYAASTPSGGVSGRVVRRGTKELIRGLYEFPLYEVIGTDGAVRAQLIVGPSAEPIPLINPQPLYRLPMLVIGEPLHGRIQQLLGAGPVEVSIELSTYLDEDAFSLNVIGEYRGAPNRRERIIVDAHYDTQLGTPGCYDNASGVAGMFGLLRRVRTDRLPVNIDFVAVAGEEIGMVGSSYLSQDLREKGELRDITACICLDQISAGQKLWIWAGPERFRAFVEETVLGTRLARMALPEFDAPMPGCDMWPLYLEGVPGCLLMWWRLDDYHKSTDTIDKVDLTKVEATVDAAYHLVRSMEGYSSVS